MFNFKSFLNLNQPLIASKPVEKSRQNSILVFLLIVFAIATISFVHEEEKSSELAVGPPRHKFWDLISKIRVRGKDGTRRTWPHFYCRASVEPADPPFCYGVHHSCDLATNIFNRFGSVYAPKDSLILPAQYPDRQYFPMRQYRLDHFDQNKHEFVSAVIRGMRKAAAEKRHMFWLVSVEPDHSFIIEQGDPSPMSFRLYQSWISGFDVNYWLQPENTISCYRDNWGTFEELRYSPNEDSEQQKQEDLRVLEQAKDIYGEFKTFDDSIFEEIIRKLSMGWMMMRKGGITTMKKLNKKEVAQSFIIEQRNQWSLRHIFGLEPISLIHMEEAPSGFYLTVRSLDLGTTEDFEQIITVPEALRAKDVSYQDIDVEGRLIQEGRRVRERLGVGQMIYDRFRAETKNPLQLPSIKEEVNEDSDTPKVPLDDRSSQAFKRGLPVHPIPYEVQEPDD